MRHAPYLTQPTRYPEEYFGSLIRGRIVDVGNAVAERFFEIEPKPEPQRLLYVGAVMQRKRLLDLIEAFARARRAGLADLALAVAGPLSDAPYAQAVVDRIDALGLRDVVQLLGPLSPDEIAGELRRAALLVLPSGQETSPMSIAEAMAAGVPVLATRTGGVPYLVGDGRTGRLVDVGDVDGLAEALVEILSGAEGRARLGQMHAQTRASGSARPPSRRVSSRCTARRSPTRDPAVRGRARDGVRGRNRPRPRPHARRRRARSYTRRGATRAVSHESGPVRAGAQRLHRRSRPRRGCRRHDRAVRRSAG